MSEISERLIVHCSDREASRHLAAFFNEHQTDDGRIRLVLRLPLNVFAERRKLIERRVIASLYPLRSIAEAHPTYSITWAPEGGGPFPVFAGALAVEKTEDDDAFTLLVSGHYDVPFGAAGAVFDAALGQRIAHASARDLLRSIADFVEQACAHSSAARAGYRRLSRC